MAREGARLISCSLRAVGASLTGFRRADGGIFRGGGCGGRASSGGGSDLRGAPPQRWQLLGTEAVRLLAWAMDLQGGGF